MGTGPPRDGQGRFVNWAGTVTTSPAAWHEPASEDDLVAIVRRAASERTRVRVVGAGHSWSAIAAPDQHAVTLDRLAGIIDERDRAVTVRAGTRLRDLTAALAARGLALPILGSIAEQSIAGAIATGTHGSSLVHGNLSSGVLGLRLVTGRGDVLDLGPGDERLDGARVHLGALGAIARVTLRVVPAFRLAETIERLPIADAVARVEEIAKSAEYVKIWWLPHTPHAHVYRYQRTDEPPTRRPSVETDRWIDDVIVQRGVFRWLLAAGRRRPAWIPSINRAIAPLLRKPRRIGASALLLSTPMPALHRETEAAVPIARAGEALDRVVRLIDRERVRVNFIVEVRFVRGDAGWMSPAHGGDVAQIGAYMGETDELERYFAAFWLALRPLGARPHWGKEMDHRADEIRALWPQAARFAALRDELDPARVFGGPFHARVLGP